MLLHKWKDVDHRGRVERVNYYATGMNGDKILKYANVYLPVNYDPAKQYNVLYLMHGGGGNADAWLDCSQVKNVFDTLFDDGTAEPFMVVFPTMYDTTAADARKDADPAERPIFFQKELREKLIPVIESTFSTYAEDVTPEGLKASRTHRAFGGFSYGGATTWWVMLKNLDIVSRFMPLSGDCWVMERMGGHTKPAETAQALRDHVLASGYTKDDFKIFAGTGYEDAAYENLVPQMDEMKKLTDVFTFSDDLEEGNCHLLLKKDAPHAYEQVYHHIYNYTPYLFK